MLNKIIRNVSLGLLLFTGFDSFAQTGRFDAIHLNFGRNKEIVWYSSSYGNGFGHKIYNADPGGKTLLNFASRHNNSNWVDRLTITSNGRIGINTDDPVSTLDVRGSFRIANRASPERYMAFQADNDGNAYYNYEGGSSNSRIAFQINANELMGIRRDGSVNIGTTQPATHYNEFFRLSVAGKIRAEEVKVYTGWADFVFEDNYVLQPLSEVESFIKEHKHLPDIPSEKEVAENGIDLGQMDSKLLQKIEELTLHMIKMDKEIQLLKEENRTLKKLLD